MKCQREKFRRCRRPARRGPRGGRRLAHLGAAVGVSGPAGASGWLPPSGAGGRGLGVFLGNLAGGRAGADVGSRGQHLWQYGSTKRRAEIDPERTVAECLFRG